MYTTAKPFLLHAITAVHAGSGSEIGLVDLPIQREQHTSFPKIESSSLKGAIRHTLENVLQEDNRQAFELTFGMTGSKDDTSQASAIAFSDARTLLFPIRSMRGVFVWVTCPQVIARFNDDMKLNNVNVALTVPKENTISSKELIVSNDQIILEEYAFNVTVDDNTVQLAKQLSSFIKQDLSVNIENRIVVVEDDTFRDFVRLSTEVNARIRMDPVTGTAAGKALWYEENVPPETVFYSTLYIGNVRGNGSDQFETAQHVESYLTGDAGIPNVFQLGGNSTLGRGMLRKIWL
ncbi:type III-B CRISPR module RAMP protein Cmr4 [Caryophanon latum]|uniref:Type III-B CRISPR module RAMP protein Cmr4 n=1 Tax=Caryophanon latum TaxID=33977 RepID=A0A1C0YV30_9BACL|nr:type III-B CRISPR module RAMP protein Cmr4 [Caryophanon latum]OCS91027.1 type III-B CRISPR module RAMP protein Cmr4 [Caryophanon latum]